MKEKKYDLIAFKTDKGSENKRYMRLGELTSLMLTEEEYCFMRRVFSKNGILLRNIEDMERIIPNKNDTSVKTKIFKRK